MKTLKGMDFGQELAIVAAGTLAGTLTALYIESGLAFFQFLGLLAYIAGCLFVWLIAIAAVLWLCWQICWRTFMGLRWLKGRYFGVRAP